MHAHTNYAQKERNFWHSKKPPSGFFIGSGKNNHGKWSATLCLDCLIFYYYPTLCRVSSFSGNTRRMRPNSSRTSRSFAHRLMQSDISQYFFWQGSLSELLPGFDVLSAHKVWTKHGACNFPARLCSRISFDWAIRTKWWGKWKTKRCSSDSANLVFLCSWLSSTIWWDTAQCISHDSM